MTHMAGWISNSDQRGKNLGFRKSGIKKFQIENVENENVENENIETEPVTELEIENTYYEKITLKQECPDAAAEIENGKILNSTDADESESSAAIVECGDESVRSGYWLV